MNKNLNIIWIISIIASCLPFLYFPNTREGKLSHIAIIQLSFLGCRLIVNTYTNEDEKDNY